MVKFSVEEVRRIMDYPKNIRNISVIAHVDHGKSTLSDALVAKAGIISEKTAGSARALDQRQDEIERGITIKSTGVSMYYRHTLNGKEEEYLINLIDSPGHVDFSSEVTAALRVTDGALVVVDAVEGVCVQTETVLRQAMQEKIRPVLMINKVDRAIHELQLTPEEMYRRFAKVIDSVNVVISTYQDENEEEILLDPTKGNVVFGAGKDQWAFSLATIARLYNKHDEAGKTFMKKAWGDNFYDEETKKWYTTEANEDGKLLQRGFAKFVMEPICKLTRAIAKGEKATYDEQIDKLKINLTQDERKLEKDKLKEFGKTVMSRWLPAADCLLETIICHLPSPCQAQRYRTPYLYEGPKDDDVFKAMANCDPKGPLCVYISKMIPIEGGRFAAFGRIFSGTVRAGERVRILGSNYQAGNKTDLYEKNVGQVGVFMMGKNPESLPDIPCGNTVALSGIDEYLLKTGTISTVDLPVSYPIRSMKYSVAPVFRVAVKAKNPADLPKLQKGLTKLSKSDPLLKVELEETGEIILCGSGELHIEICINDLRAFSQCEIVVAEPVVSYKETMTMEVEEPLLTKSANKLNRIFGTSAPLNDRLVEMIENEEINPKGDTKTRSEILVTQFDWSKTDAQKIWCFGPENVGSNVLVDMVTGAQYVNEIKDSVCSSFQFASKAGVLAEESLRGCRFNITDAQVHQDPAHRGGGQILPASRRLFQGLQIASMPTLLEPIFMCEISAPSQALGGVYKTLTQRRGQVVEENNVEGSPMSIVKAYVPVAETFGLSTLLRENTHGMAFPQNIFDHWAPITGLPFEDNKARDLVLSIRKRKGLKEEMPLLQNFVDKL
jgi:elongation factor 2